MSEDRTVAARGSEFLREASVLVLIFGFLDPLVQPVHDNQARTLSARLENVELSWAVLVIALSVVFFFMGIKLDRVRMADSGAEEPPASAGDT